MRRMENTKKMYVTATEAAELLGVSNGYAYKIIRGLNDELKAKGRASVIRRTRGDLRQRQKRNSGNGIFDSNKRKIWISILRTSFKFIMRIWNIDCVRIPYGQRSLSLI